MKRLLAYLFLVLGLGLVFNDDANAGVILIEEERKAESIRGFCIDEGYGKKTFKVTPQKSQKSCKKINFINSIDHPNQFNKLFNFYFPKYKQLVQITMDYQSGNYDKILNFIEGTTLYASVKKEPTQTQQIAEKETKGICIVKADIRSNLGFFAFKIRPYSERKCVQSKLIKKEIYPSQYAKLNEFYKNSNREQFEGILYPNKYIKKKELYPLIKGTFIYDKLKTEDEKNNLKIAKAEPSQTQQVAESAFPDCKGSKSSKWTNCHGTETYADGGTKYVGEWKDGKWHGQGTMIWADGTIDNGIWKRGKLIKRQ